MCRVFGILFDCVLLFYQFCLYGRRRAKQKSLQQIQQRTNRVTAAFSFLSQTEFILFLFDDINCWYRNEFKLFFFSLYKLDKIPMFQLAFQLVGFQMRSTLASFELHTLIQSIAIVIRSKKIVSRSRNLEFLWIENDFL